MKVKYPKSGVIGWEHGFSQSVEANVQNHVYRAKCPKLGTSWLLMESQGRCVKAITSDGNSALGTWFFAFTEIKPWYGLLIIHDKIKIIIKPYW